MDIFNPLLVLTLIPIFEFIIFPLLRRLKISFPPIRQMTVGLILTGLSFVSAAILQFEIDVSLETNEITYCCIIESPGLTK